MNPSHVLIHLIGRQEVSVMAGAQSILLKPHAYNLVYVDSNVYGS
jgi:hypothetical protein